MMKENTEWLLCPVCGNKTRDRIRSDTVLINYPLYCPKGKQETLISVVGYHQKIPALVTCLFQSMGQPGEKSVLDVGTSKCMVCPRRVTRIRAA